MNRRREIIDKIGTIISIPTYVAQAIQELQKDDVDLRSVIQTIETDPSITANILKLVNSTAFAADHPITSLFEAGVKIGSYNLLELIVGSSMSGIMNKSVPGYDLPPGDLWRSSVIAGIFTDVIGDVLKIKVPDHAFTAALLRDVGKILLGTFIDIDANEICQHAVDNDISFPEAEYAVLGIDHAEVGAFLLRKWRLPEQLCIPVRWHHSPDETTEESLVTCVVHVADALTSLEGCGVGIDGLKYRISEHAVSKLKLNTSLIERIMSEGATRIEAVTEMLTME